MVSLIYSYRGMKYTKTFKLKNLAMLHNNVLRSKLNLNLSKSEEI